MSDPSGMTGIILGVMPQYGRGPSACAPLEYPDGTEEWVLARGHDRLLAKVWKSKLRTWAAKAGVRTGTAYLGPIFCGPHRGGEFGALSGTLSRVYGEAVVERLLPDLDERLGRESAEVRAHGEKAEAFAQQWIAKAEQVLEQYAIAGDEAGQVALQEDIAEVKAARAKAREAMAAAEAASAEAAEARDQCVRARDRWLEASRLYKLRARRLPR